MLLALELRLTDFSSRGSLCPSRLHSSITWSVRCRNSLIRADSCAEVPSISRLPEAGFNICRLEPITKLELPPYVKGPFLWFIAKFGFGDADLKSDFPDVTDSVMDSASLAVEQQEGEREAIDNLRIGSGLYFHTVFEIEFSLWGSFETDADRKALLSRWDARACSFELLLEAVLLPKSLWNLTL